MLVALLVGLIILAIVLVVAWFILGLIPFPPEMAALKTVIWLVILLIALLFLLGYVGVLPGVGR